MTYYSLSACSDSFFFLQIADFGLSNLYHKDKLLQTFCGSPLYASPEIVNGRPYRGPEVHYELIFSSYANLYCYLRGIHFSPLKKCELGNTITSFLSRNDKREQNTDKEKAFPLLSERGETTLHCTSKLSHSPQESLNRPSQSAYPASSIIQWETKTLPKRMRTNLKAIFRISSILIAPSWLLIFNSQTQSLSGSQEYIKIPIVFSSF